ncbi:ABC transporter substrate-binding protein [bacterium]|nr:ABC transporter substrate-binding protein [bacterium]
MKKSYKILIIFVVLVLGLKSCLHVDKPINPNEQNTNNSKITSEFKEVINKKNVSLNGVDYLQSQLPIGKFGGTFFTSTLGEGPQTFNPFNSKDATSSEVADMLFDGLVQTDANSGEVIPKLAKDIKINNNGKNYVITLRKGIKWSDGMPITADDVFYTWDTIIFGGYGNTSTRDALYINGKLPVIKKIDDYTVEFILSQPFAPFLRNLSTAIAPKHIFKPVTDKGKDAFNSFLSANANVKNIVSSGAFLFEQYLPAQRVILKRNPNYYVINLQNQKLPYLDKYVILIVGDQNNQLLKFEAGELDVIGLKGSDIARYKEKEAKNNFALYNLGPTTSTMFLAFNLTTFKNDRGKNFVEKHKQEWFNSKKFRTAIDYAINRENMVFNIANGAAQPLFTAEALPSIYLNEKIAQGHKQNVDYAKELLIEDGFYYNSQSELFDKNNNRVEFNLLTNAGNLEREAIGVMIKQDLEDIGIKVNFRPIEFNSLVGKLTNSRDWDTVILGLTGNPLEPYSGKNVWASNGALHLFNQRINEKELKNILPWEKELDEIFEKSPLVIDFESRKKYYDRYQEIIYEQKPILYLYSPLNIVAVKNRVKNLQPSKLTGIINNIDEIWLEN